MVRCFAAISISDEIQSALESFKEQAFRSAKEFKSAKWVRSENLHLTLKFFGEVERDRIGALEESISASVHDQKNFSVKFCSGGCFPNDKRPQVLWVGITDGASVLEKLAANLEERTTLRGFVPSDKPFSPHLTLARFSNFPLPDLSQILSALDKRVFGKIDVVQISLIQSELKPAGPVYTVLREFPFRAD